MFLSKPNQFAAQVETAADHAVVRLSGELDIAWIEELRSAIGVARAAGCERIVIDLRALSFIDSTGVSELLRTTRSGMLDGIRVEYLRAPGEVARVLDLMRVSDLLPLAA